MRRIVRYKSKTPDYGDQEQVFIGYDEDEVNRLQWEFEDWLCYQHEIKMISTHYDVETIYERD